MDRCQILELCVDRISRGDALNALQAFIASRTPHQVATVNMDFVRIARRDPAFRDAVNNAHLAVADGMPVVWLSRLLGRPIPERITGVDLVDDCAAMAATHGYSVFLFGAEPGVAELAATVLQRRHPGLQIAGTYAPPMGEVSPEEEVSQVERIRQAHPDILFVAFGAPRQELWIADHLHDLHVPVCVGVGGSFNFISGRQPRAPRWLQRAGMEWAHRLAHEPRRLWRRYLFGDLPILLRVLGALLLSLTGWPATPGVASEVAVPSSTVVAFEPKIREQDRVADRPARGPAG